jgi:prepilin signal peptidase PulO-like enzyme (type II secretory pathway)
MIADQAVVKETRAQEMQQPVRRAVWFIIPFGMLATLAFLPFLGDRVAAETAVLICMVVYATLGAIDLFTMKVPNAVVYPAICFALLATAIIDASMLPGATAGGLASLGVMVVLGILSRGNMGMGDVKAACFGGCVAGLKGGVISIFLGFALGAVVALPVVVLGFRSRKDPMPLTPFLAGGFLVYGLLYGFPLAGAL